MSAFEPVVSVPDHILSINDISTGFIEQLLRSADSMRDLVATSGGDTSLKHKLLGCIFYEPSTRTSCSFQAAMLRLGGSVVCVNGSDSSVKKGETLQDTIQTMACYCDILALRHPEKGSAHSASLVSKRPVINAGDGVGEHPTQALLDLYTIRSELGRINGTGPESKLIVTLLGDLRNGRTVHSLVKLLSRFPHVSLIYVSPKGLELPDYIYDEVCSNADVDQVATMTLDEAISVTDVLYVTRIQKERFSSSEEYSQVMGSYCVDTALMKKAKAKMVVMHPLPRVDEIAIEVDSDSRAAYFRY